jgi:hypothetical protein
MQSCLHSVLKGKFLLLFTLFFFIFEPFSLEAAYKIYLKSGKVISGVDEVTEEDGTVKILKQGVSLTVQQESIEKIEEYEAVREEDSTSDIPSEEDVPEYLEYNDEKRQEYDDEQQQEEVSKHRIEKQQLEDRYQTVINKLNRIDELEEKSEKLGYRIFRNLRLEMPRKARIARKEKAEVDEELSQLQEEKEELESRLRRYR